MPLEEVTDETQMDQINEPSLARFLDFTVFLETLELARLAPTSQLKQQALTLARQTQNDFLVDAAAYLEPLFNIRGFGKFKTKWKPLSRPATSVDRFVLRGTFLRDFILALSKRPEVFRSTFPDARLLAQARRLVQVSEAGSGPAALAVLGAMRTLAGMNRLRAWVKAAVAESGVEISEFDDIVASIGEAEDLGKQLSATESALQVPQTEDEHEKLEIERDELKAQIEVTAAESPDASTVLAAAAKAAQPRAYQTKTGEELGLDPQQEEAMVARGEVIVAAKAGSGKTRVIAGKVVYHVKELGVRPTQIVATSFSKKSGDELIERIRKYGGEAMFEDSVALEGFGTTHSIALKLLKKAYPRLKARGSILKDGDVKFLMKMAMQQVRMQPTQSVGPPDYSETFFSKPFVLPDTKAQVVEEDKGDQPSSLGTMPPTEAPAAESSEAAIKRLAKQALNSGQFFGWPRDFLASLAERGSGTRSGTLSEKQAKHFLQLMRQAGIDPSPVTNASVSAAAGGAFDYFKMPVNQWFNLGLGDKAFRDANGRPMGPKQVGMFLTRWRAGLVTPGQAALLSEEQGMPPEYAAAYAAYEWLKHNHHNTAGRIDFDDMLIMACQALISNPRMLSEVQNRWKVVLVDEAQDLSTVQHLLFGLIAGYYNPETQEPWGDGRMTADTYAFVGDDAQAIYGFRGADVELFIDKSDLVGGPFATKKIATNYRSGKAIVDAASQLIKHNSKQIPMECKTNEDRKGVGYIHYVNVDSHDDGAKLVAEEIKDLVSSGVENYGEMRGVPTFGIGVRTNAEAYAFAAEMLKFGIPFKSKVSFFNDRTTKAILSWLSIAADPNDKATVNEAVLTAHEAPKFFLDKTFNQNLQEQARGQNYLTFLENGGWRNIYSGNSTWKNEKNVLPYTRALSAASKLGANASPLQAFESVINIKGIGVGSAPGMSMLDSLVADAKDDPELLDSIREETENEPGLEGQFTEDDVKALALAPVRPLQGLLEGYSDLSLAMKYIEKLKDANKKLDKSRKTGEDADVEEESIEPAVVIDTIHGWKGLEAKRMYVPMAKGVFPHRNSETSDDGLQAERRLGYVAITRGQDRVTILAPRVSHQGQPAGPSRFISEACIIGDDGNVIPEKKTVSTEEVVASLRALEVLFGALETVDEDEHEEYAEADDVLGHDEPSTDGELSEDDAEVEGEDDEDEAFDGMDGAEIESEEEIAASTEPAESLKRSQALLARLKS